MDPEIIEYPIPEAEAQKLLTFPEAIAEATIGKSIQRIGWPEIEFGYFKDNFLYIRRGGPEGYKDYIWQVSHGDAVETDWVSF